MVDEVEFAVDEIAPLLRDLGLLTGLLAPGDRGGDSLLFELSWFSQAPANLKAIPARRARLMAVLRDLVGGLTPTAVAGRDWYPVRPSGAASYVHVVLPPDDSGTTSTIGVGVLTPLPTGAGGDRAYAYFPIVLLTEGSDPQVVTGQRVGGQAYPIELGLTIGDSLEFVGDVYFTAAPSATLTLATTSPPTVVTTLSQLLDAKAVVDTVLGLPKVRGLLNTDLGPTTITVGGLLAAIGLLEPAGAGYQLASLSAFLDQTPLQIAEALLAGVLKMLASDETPLVPIGAGGVWIFGEPAGTGVTDYGLRLQVPDVDVSPSGGPTVALQLGKFLSVDSAAGTWIKRSDPNATYPDPGVLLTLVREAGTTPAFRPRVDLVSLGVDVTGRDGAPLVDVEGVRLGGVEPRILVSLDFADLTRVPWGAAARFDGLGIPLGDGLAAGVDNPVAQNLLSSGSGSSPGGDPQAVNPTFSATIGWITDPTVAGATLDVHLEQADGSPGGGGPVWLPVQRAFGPLQCRRVGVQWDDARRVLTFLFDGDVALSVLEVDLEGLSLGIPLQTPGQLGTYALGLQGLAVSYASGPLAISGGFLEDTGATPTEYEGEALIKAETWAIGALGAYATLDGHPSLFIFAVLDATIGGPPFFVVTGLCAGFGYNRSLRMPTQDQVPDFPLLAGIADPAAIGGPNPSPAQALAALEDWVRPAQGVDWFAAGVQFTSFELVQSNAVLVAVVGAGFEIAVLGISRIKLPQAGPQFAYAELGLEVLFDPTDGVLSASAVLTPNSYVINPACHLTGGFAFDVWSPPNPHAGDFVVTLGGYHPAFTPPAWYPDEPRLGFSWQLSEHLTIQGDAYFALTPSAVMGGGGLNVQFHAGNFHAWFLAHADFLFSWKPYYFTGSIGVSVGFSYKLDLLFVSVTIKVEIGADLDIHGPPTGGQVHVHLWIVSFTVSFGADEQGVQGYVGWDDFRGLLPQNDPPPKTAAVRRLAATAPGDASVPLTNVVKVLIGAGLVKLEADGSWLVRCDDVTFAIQTAFPLTEVDLDGPGAPEKLTPPGTGSGYFVGIRPMGYSSVESVMTVTLGYLPPGGGKPETVDLPREWSANMTLQSVPAALWGTPLTPLNPNNSPPPPPAPSADTLPNRLMGLNSLTPNPSTPTGPPPIPMANLAHDPIDQDASDFLPLSSATPAVARQPQASATSLETIASTIATPAVATTRTAVAAALAAFGYDVGPDGPTDALAANANLSYPDPPLLGAPWGGTS